MKKKKKKRIKIELTYKINKLISYYKIMSGIIKKQKFDLASFLTIYNQLIEVACNLLFLSETMYFIFKDYFDTKSKRTHLQVDI